eukprot:m.136042 g.136042  ORF g.136042 m.136042 type:complete len:341 (-) comp10382_c0_seq1:782-1804(-)
MTWPAEKPKRPENEFYWDKESEPHALRRKDLLNKYPKVKDLMGPCPKTKWIILATVVFQFYMAYLCTTLPWYAVFFLAYAVSGTLNHMMMMGIHELSHNLAFKLPEANKVLSIFASLPLGLPVAISFRRYHLEHHKYQGEDGIDVDVPTRTEALLFKTWYGKFLWMVMQPIFYSIRPMIIRPKKLGPWEFANLVVVVLVDYFMFTYVGPASLFYMIGGALLGAGLHPVAGHFLGEHLVWNKGETYSYYGPLNFFTFNVGYHNEHHDFANIPGSRLPEVRNIAAEFYDDLPRVTSWVGVIYDFIFNYDARLFDRTKRDTLSKGQHEQISLRDHKLHGEWKF